MSNAPRTDSQNFKWVNGAPHDVNVVYVILIKNSLESNWDKYI